MEFKGAMTYKMELGGLWLVGSMESDLGGQKFYGKSLDTYEKSIDSSTIMILDTDNELLKYLSKSK